MANSNDLKLAGIADWEVSKPEKKKSRTRKATLVEPEVMETDEDYGEKEDRACRGCPWRSGQGGRVPEQGPSAGSSAVHSSSASLRKRPHDVIASHPRPYKTIRKKQRGLVSVRF